jgi:hypothetical protein
MSKKMTRRFKDVPHEQQVRAVLRKIGADMVDSNFSN